MDGLLPLPPLLVHIKLVLVHSKGVPCIPSDPTPDNAAIIQTMAPPHNNEALPPADRILRVSKSSILDGRDCATLNAADEHRKETVVASSKSESKVQVSDARRREPTAFLSDQEIAQSRIFRAAQSMACAYSSMMYQFSVEGHERLPKDRAALIVTLHTYHSGDIGICLLNAQKVTGRVIRGLLHRLLMRMAGFIRFLGVVPGYRDTAEELLSQGFWVGVVPGGAEEVMMHASENGKHAYETAWNSKEGQARCGFARVALKMGPGFEVFPCFCENGEEMKINPLADLWTFLRLDFAWGALARMMPFFIRWWMLQIAIVVAFTVSSFGIPLPVKVTQHIGEAVVVQKDDTAETLAERIRGSLQSLIDVKQKRRHRSYFAALCDRWCPGTAASEKKDQ